MFGSFSRIFVAEPVLFAMPVNSPHHAMLLQDCHRVLNWVSGYTRSIYMIYHVQVTLYRHSVWTILQSWHAIPIWFKYTQIHLIEKFFATWKIKVISDKSTAVFTAGNVTPHPLFLLNLNCSLVHCGREVKYLVVYLDSTLTWCGHIEYTVCNFYKDKNNLAHLTYSYDINMTNKLLVYKMVLKDILVYCAPICDSEENSNNQQRCISVAFRFYLNNVLMYHHFSDTLDI